MLLQTQPLRSASRQVVRELGMLDAKCGPVGLSHSCCHILMELEVKGPLSLMDLAETVRLDKSTASRLVNQLDESGLLQVREDGKDKRKINISLSEQGREKVAQVHEAANKQVEDALILLPEADRAKVAEGMCLYARALHRARLYREVHVRPIRPEDDAELARVIRQVMLSFKLDELPTSTFFDSELSQMSGAYTQNGCAYFIAEREGALLGGGGIGPLVGGDGSVCELRKMYLLPEARGYGLGQRLLDSCLEAAKELGYKICYLETMSLMDEARKLYLRNGFQPMCSPQGNTGHSNCDQWYSLSLLS